MSEKVSSILAKQITFCNALLKQILVSVTETAFEVSCMWYIKNRHGDNVYNVGKFNELLKPLKPN